MLKLMGPRISQLESSLCKLVGKGIVLIIQPSPPAKEQRKLNLLPSSSLSFSLYRVWLLLGLNANFIISITEPCC